jgi:hypothetical protein
MSDKPSQKRKREAATDLRTLAGELQLSDRGRNADLNATGFSNLFHSVFASCTTPEQKQRAEKARDKYEGTHVTLPVVPQFPGSVAASAASTSQVQLPRLVSGSPITAPAPHGPKVAGKGFRLRGTSCLFTYNSPNFCNTDPKALWEAFLAFIKALDFLRRWTATAEESLHSQNRGRVHLHAFMEFKEAVDWTALDLVTFQGSRPDAKSTIARGTNQQSVINQGHFYVFADKVGSLFVETSGWAPWTDYPVKGWWIDELWTQHKLSHDKYLQYAVEVRTGFMTRSRQVQALKDRERSTQLQDKQRLAAQQLLPLKRAFQPAVLRQLEPWRLHYQTLDDRYKFLVLRGVSRSGKSSLAKALGALMNWGKPFVQTVQGATAADLKKFSEDEHGYLIFDNVNDQEFILSQRALFQANNEIHTLAESKTGIYSYEVWLHAKPIVITVDTSARWDPREDLIAANCFDIFLDQPCYM